MFNQYIQYISKPWATLYSNEAVVCKSCLLGVLSDAIVKQSLHSRNDGLHGVWISGSQKSRNTLHSVTRESFYTPHSILASASELLWSFSLMKLQTSSLLLTSQTCISRSKPATDPDSSNGWIHPNWGQVPIAREDDKIILLPWAATRLAQWNEKKSSLIIIQSVSRFHKSSSQMTKVTWD